MELNLLKKLDLVLDENRRDKITKVGPSLWGYIYRSENKKGCYRIIPIEQASLENRHKTRQWTNIHGMEGFAQIIEVGPCQVLNKNDKIEAFYILYRTESQTTWADIIENPELSTRLEYASKLINCFSQWRNLVSDNPQSYSLPMPNDIVFVNKKPYLLGMPFWGQPDIKAIFEAPERILYLPPEFIKGQREKINGRNIDLYALGISLFQCIYKMDELISVDWIFKKIATGSYYLPKKFKERFPFWLERTEVFNKLLTDINSMINMDPRIRNMINTDSLASRLDTYRIQLTPEAVINSLRYNGRYQEAFSTIQDILLDNTTYDLLLLAGSIAKDNLKKILEGIDYFERAISRDNERINAYEMQLLTILETIHEIGEKSVQELIKYEIRDFDKLPPEKQKKYEEKTARCLITQKAYKEALKFIYPRLFEGDKFLWWNFDMNIVYTETLIKLNKLNDAQKNLNEIKNSLQKVKMNKSIEPEEIKRIETQIKLFEKYISNQ